MARMSGSMLLCQRNDRPPNNGVVPRRIGIADVGLLCNQCQSHSRFSTSGSPYCWYVVSKCRRWLFVRWSNWRLSFFLLPRLQYQVSRYFGRKVGDIRPTTAPVFHDRFWDVLPTWSVNSCYFRPIFWTIFTGGITWETYEQPRVHDTRGIGRTSSWQGSPFLTVGSSTFICRRFERSTDCLPVKDFGRMRLETFRPCCAEIPTT